MKVRRSGLAVLLVGVAALTGCLVDTAHPAADALGEELRKMPGVAGASVSLDVADPSAESINSQMHIWLRFGSDPAPGDVAAAVIRASHARDNPNLHDFATDVEASIDAPPSPPPTTGPGGVPPKSTGPEQPRVAGSLTVNGTVSDAGVQSQARTLTEIVRTGRYTRVTVATSSSPNSTAYLSDGSTTTLAQAQTDLRRLDVPDLRMDHTVHVGPLPPDPSSYTTAVRSLPPGDTFEVGTSPDQVLDAMEAVRRASVRAVQNGSTAAYVLWLDAGQSYDTSKIGGPYSRGCLMLQLSRTGLNVNDPIDPTTAARLTEAYSTALAPSGLPFLIYDNADSETDPTVLTDGCAT